MNKSTFFAIAFLTVAGGACSTATPPANTSAPITNAAPASNADKPKDAPAEAAHKTDDETPAAVRAAFPEAQSFSKQHKDVPANAIAAIEKDTGGKIADKDHHSYLAFAARDGKRTQIGAATVVKAEGKEMLVVYESVKGMPTIKEVRADGIAKEFLAQFNGKNHDTPIKFGDDVKALGGVSEAQARSIAQAVRMDVLTMEALYGAAHSH